MNKLSVALRSTGSKAAKPFLDCGEWVVAVNNMGIMVWVHFTSDCWTINSKLKSCQFGFNGGTQLICDQMRP